MFVVTVGLVGDGSEADSRRRSGHHAPRDSRHYLAGVRYARTNEDRVDPAAYPRSRSREGSFRNFNNFTVDVRTSRKRARRGLLALAVRGANEMDNSHRLPNKWAS